MGLFQALVELKQGHSAAIQPLHFHFVGWPGSSVIQFLSEMGLEDCVFLDGTAVLFAEPEGDG